MRGLISGGEWGWGWGVEDKARARAHSLVWTNSLFLSAGLVFPLWFAVQGGSVYMG